MEKIDPYEVFTPTQVNVISCALIGRVVEIKSRSFLKIPTTRRKWAYAAVF
ncbi:hypothetical protein ERICIV_02979 [Paenibacillus larvae subsp. larvae]|uniref:Uncharacterized protein n=1 Tax=Paenibacillus larvae subsp. larvae TaxID=147375 RepID=A0A2L1U2N7_9BACL|nr:hypothetical protein [Paenibacillus larvae]AVF27203.1 hypothetical protein ERICIII_03076 [Paenibacillus larvae subsp. larvae]AVF31866.1 hypothetical protein ERICIV_02979 [Paenibacillus larvae subsp. larvae]MCY7522119.1 hypothetical protein [Paenibacillus larvae]MCY9500128.1 hypothetical protein [Paenibacillus larvae]MCY9677881.1 hypothetical protein [Paenibacillus larvae]